ncbi:hypothetical protein DL98DRAFT_521954 [Cadophora sp. DSE1049]|nr:hypothetical protein DL98DRAFT_521954 [Cadophora sp. DSE1049]
MTVRRAFASFELSCSRSSIAGACADCKRLELSTCDLNLLCSGDDRSGLHGGVAGMPS